MLELKSTEFKTFFLLQFTKELINNSGGTEILELKNLLKERLKEKEDKIKEIIQKKEINHEIARDIKGLPLLKPKIITEIFPKKKNIIPQSTNITGKPIQYILKIPQPKIPPQFQYLKPIPTQKQIDLSKLNPLIKDPQVKIIECNGVDQNIIVKGNMGTKKTNIILNKIEIDNVIKKFSEETRIPVQGGVFKVAIGKLIFSAIISEVISSKFIINKMAYQPAPVLRR
ncbi:MAG: hypothetical protein KJ646_00240 [Nanoarchaeota archaeon]|nr:hypothetical protein [Nanoarchaeota archaeon]MBU4116555.1 hypothetical protein [Nanoarchaeota archaeon]